MVVAAMNIPAFAVVALNSSGEAYLPSALTLSDANLILGIAINGALTGETFSVQTTGILDTSPSWTIGPLYLSSTTPGALTSTVPAAPAYQFWVATAADSSRLIVRPLFPIILA